MKKFLSGLDTLTISIIIGFVLITCTLLWGCWQYISIH